MAVTKISNARIDAARILYEGIKKGRVLDPATMSPDYLNNSSKLQDWVNKKFIAFRNNCTDPDYFESWIAESDQPELIISKFISVAAISHKPQYNKSQFPLYADPRQTIKALLDSCQDCYDQAMQFYDDSLLEEEVNRVEAGEDISIVQAQCYEAIEEAAPITPASSKSSEPNPTSNIVNPVYISSGSKQSADYMNQLYALGYTFRLNNVTNRIEVNGKEISDSVLSRINLDMIDTGFKSRQMIQDCITVLAKQNEYHPVKEYFHNLTWDHEPRIDLFVTLLNPTNPDLAKVLFKKWMIGAIAKVEDQGQNTMLVLDGNQGVGKSYLAKWLCPLPEYHKEGSIRPDDKASQMAACSKFIWEVGELGKTIRSSDHEALKDFLTTRDFSILEPYAHYITTRPAMASFIGTINDQGGFLKDPTGNRRFWIIEIGAIDHSYSDLYSVHDLWAEAYAYYKAGETNTLTDHEYKAVLDIQEEYKTPNITAEAILNFFDIDPNRNDWVTSVYDVRETLKNQGGLSEIDLRPYNIGAAIKELGLPKAFPKKVNGSNMKHYRGLKPKDHLY